MTDTTIAALLASARAAPDDDAPRLVLADWLEENAGAVVCRGCGGSEAHNTGPKWCRACSGSGRVGNGWGEWAEFIRVQVELAKIGPAWDIEPECGESDWICGVYAGGDAVVVTDVVTPPPVGSRASVRVSPKLKIMRGMRVSSVSAGEPDRGSPRYNVHLRRDEYSGKAAAKMTDALRRRERELLIAHHRAWSPPALNGYGWSLLWGFRLGWPTSPAADIVATFARGFISHIRITWADALRHLDRILAHPLVAAPRVEWAGEQGPEITEESERINAEPDERWRVVVFCPKKERPTPRTCHEDSSVGIGPTREAAIAAALAARWPGVRWV